MRSKKICNIEETYKATFYRAEYNGKEIQFKYEQQKYKPQPRLRVMSYDRTFVEDMDLGLVKKLNDALNEIEDLSNVKLL